MHPQPSEIPPEQWASTLDHFSRAHHGQRAELIIVAPDSGQHAEAHQLPLLGVTTEPADGGQRITIAAASPEGTHVSHEVANPTSVRLSEWNDGVSGQLEIDARDGFQARIRVGPAEQTLPEGAVLDGDYPVS